MSDKKMSQLFSKYTPMNKGQSDIFENSSDIRVRADKERRMYEIFFSYPTPLKTKILFELEKNLAEFYDLESVRLFPTFPAETFSEDYIPEIVEAAKKNGTAVKGFFKEYKPTLDGNVLKLEI